MSMDQKIIDHYGKMLANAATRQTQEQSSTETSSGIKHDQGKAPWHLLPYDALEEVVHVLQFGAQKYGDRNWEQGMEYSRPYSAAMRHLTSWFMGMRDDEETGFNHLAHAACCILLLLAYEKRGIGKDDRP